MLRRQIDVLHLEVGQLADPQSVAGQHREKRPLPIVARGEKRPFLLRRKDPGARFHPPIFQPVHPRGSESVLGKWREHPPPHCPRERRPAGGQDELDPAELVGILFLAFGRSVSGALGAPEPTDESFDRSRFNGIDRSDLERPAKVQEPLQSSPIAIVSPEGEFLDVGDEGQIAAHEIGR